MIHASNELMEAVSNAQMGTTLDRIMNACDGTVVGRAAFSTILGTTEEFHAKVDCPRCLLLMREAIGPVRWDSLEERGLVSLPATSEKPRTR